MVRLVPSPSNCIAHLSYWAKTPWLEGILVSKACLWSGKLGLHYKNLVAVLSYILGSLSATLVGLYFNTVWSQ